MRYLIVSRNGASLGLAQKLEREGHTVCVHIVNQECQRKGVGLVSIIKTPRPIKDRDGVYNISAVEWLMNTARPDITIFDSPDTHIMATRMQLAGRHVIGTTTDTVPNPRDAGLTPAQYSQYALETWFNGNKFVPPNTLLTRYTKLFNSNKGPYCPSTGAVSRRIETLTQYEPQLDPIVMHLRKTSYRGPVTLYLSSESGEVEDYEAGMSPENFLCYENLKGDLSTLLTDIVYANNTQHELIEEHSVMVRLTLPPWPYKIPSECASTTVRGIDDANLRHLWLDDIQLVGEEYVTTGADNNIGFVTARGESVKEARRRVYRTIQNLDLDTLQCRTDIAAERSLTSVHS